MIQHDREFDFRSQKEGWKFAISAKQLQAAADARLRFHQSRLEHWSTQELRRENALREKGIDFRQTARRGSTGAVAYAAGELRRQQSTVYQQEPVFHQEMLEALREAQDKVGDHLDLVKIYTTWARALALKPPEEMLYLTIADVEFFDLAGTVNLGLPEDEKVAVEA